MVAPVEGTSKVEHCVVGQGQQPMRRLPVRRGGSLPEGAELNTTLALRAELDDVAGAEFNSQKAVQEQLQKSARTKNSISAWATEGVNVPPSQHLYRALVSVNVEEELISQALRDWLQPWQQGSCGESGPVICVIQCLWRFRPWDLGDTVCKLSVFVSESCTYSSILHITALSLERYLAVCRPLTAKTLVTRTRVRTLIGCLWVVAVISAGPVFAMVGVEELGGGEGESECRCTDYAVSSGLLGAMMWLSNLYFLVPLGILGVVYGLIGRKLWLRPQRSSRDRAQRHTIKMLGMIVLAFVLCWLPFHVGRTLFSVTLGSSADMYYVSQYFNLVSFVLFYLSAAVNPILYNTMSARYRHAVRSLLRSHTHSHRSHHPPLTPQHSTTTL